MLSGRRIRGIIEVSGHKITRSQTHLSIRPQMIEFTVHAVSRTDVSGTLRTMHLFENDTIFFRVAVPRRIRTIGILRGKKTRLDACEHRGIAPLASGRHRVCTGESSGCVIIRIDGEVITVDISFDSKRI